MSNSNPGRVTKVWPGIEYSNVSIKTTSLSLTLMYVTKLPSRPYSGGTGPANQSKGTVDLFLCGFDSHSRLRFAVMESLGVVNFPSIGVLPGEKHPSPP